MPEWTLLAEPYDGPVASRLVSLVQAEYVDRYGTPDETPIGPGEFLPPDGLFLVGYVGGEAVACGGLRRLREGVAEIKRMYVVAAWRRGGLARRLLAGLEHAATTVGYREVWLETGTAQPEALAFYRATGYAPIPAYGHYRCAPESRCFGKRLAISRPAAPSPL